jgi:hypothetical protein
MGALMTTLKRTLKRIVRPEIGNPFVLTLTPDGFLAVKKLRRRKGSERVYDLRDAFEKQIGLPFVKEGA